MPRGGENARRPAPAPDALGDPASYRSPLAPGSGVGGRGMLPYRRDVGTLRTWLRHELGPISRGERRGLDADHHRERAARLRRSGRDRRTVARWRWRWGRARHAADQRAGHEETKGEPSVKSYHASLHGAST